MGRLTDLYKNYRSNLFKRAAIRQAKQVAAEAETITADDIMNTLNTIGTIQTASELNQSIHNPSELEKKILSILKTSKNHIDLIHVNETNIEQQLLILLGDGLRFDRNQLMNIASLALYYQFPNFARACVDAMKKIDNPPLKYPSNTRLYHLAGRFLPRTELLEALEQEQLTAENRYDRIIYPISMLNGILDSERFDLFEEAHQIIMKKISGLTVSSTALLTLNERAWNDVKRDTEKKLDLMNMIAVNPHLPEIVVNIKMLLLGKKNLFNEALKALTLELSTALDAQELGLSEKLRLNFPVPDTEVLLDFRRYPKAESLNPNKIELKKYSILKKILCENLQKHGLIADDLASPDKYLGFVTEDEVSSSGLFSEALFTSLIHGKLTHLIQWYCIAWAYDLGQLDLHGLTLTEVRDMFVKNEYIKDHKIWGLVFDLSSYKGKGYSTPSNLFLHLLTLDNCLGSYSRASLDHQLQKLVSLYQEIPYENNDTKAQITPTLLLHQASLPPLAGSTFVPAINNRLSSELLKRTHQHYVQKTNADDIENAGENAFIIKSHKPK